MQAQPCAKQKITKPGKTRRQFLRDGTLFLGGLWIVPSHVLGGRHLAPSDKINLGIIGLGKQGNILANKFKNETQAQIIAGSDVWDTKRSAFTTKVEEMYANKAGGATYSGVKTYLEYGEMLERDDLDGVIVATPDHWHALQSIAAMEAGKDVYCEKPLTNTIHEGRQIADAVARTNRIFQTGSMQRSWEKFRLAQEIIAGGKLGKITKVLVNVGDPARDYDLPAEALPAGIDWNRWCGPAPLLPYHHSVAPAIVNKYPDWRDFRETGGGILSDWGAHMFDIAQWCLGMDHTGPIKYLPPGDPAAVRGLRMFYANGVEMVHEDFGRNWAVRFIGSEGTLDVSRSFLETSPGNILTSVASNSTPEFNDRGNHYQNWLDGMRTRTQPNCPAEIGHRTATVCNAANIAYQLGRPLAWDPVEEQFLDDKAANKLRKRRNRKFNRS